MTDATANNPSQPAADGASRWLLTIYHPDGTVEERPADFAEMVRAAACHSRFTASPMPEPSD